MCELKIYSISDCYISYLRSYVPEVYTSKEFDRIHTRKYIGIVYKINGFNYYIPLSSPKKSDFIVKDGINTVRKSVVPIMRMTEAQSDGKIHLLGTIRISHMIPVPDSELVLYDLDNEIDIPYRNFVQKEVIFIRKNKDKIISNAELLYKQKINNDTTANYIKSALNYRLLEEKHDSFVTTKLALAD